MKFALTLVAAATLLAATGCATRAPAGTGTTVRDIFASQILPSPPRTQDRGTDGVAAAAAVANYQRSYVTPTSQSDASQFTKK